MKVNVVIKNRVVLFAAVIFLSIVATSQVRASVKIVVPQEKKQDAGLMLAVSDLCLVIKDSTIRIASSNLVGRSPF